MLKMGDITEDIRRDTIDNMDNNKSVLTPSVFWMGGLKLCSPSRNMSNTMCLTKCMTRLMQ